MTKRKMFFRMIMASLTRRRSRMIVALLAIMIGATILSGLVTIYYDVPRQMGAQFRSYGANMIITGREGAFPEREVDSAISLIPGNEVVGVAPYRYVSVKINDRPIMAAGTDMDGASKTSPFWVVTGEWPSESGEIMIGENVAATFRFRIGDEITVYYTPEGQTVEADSAEEPDESDESDESVDDIQPAAILDLSKVFKVVGILDTGGSEEDYVYMSLQDMEELTEVETVLDLCELSISASGDKLSGYADNISESEVIEAKLVKRVTESETTVLSKLQALVLLVTIVVLALTMICVATTMTAVVTERRKEIGLRKALGASDSGIIKEFTGETLLLGALGGLLGAGLGFLFAQVVSMSVFNSSISFRIGLLPITIIVSVIVTGIASLLPIRSATNVDPALVLKGE